MTSPVPKSDWIWYGSAGHFICGQWCRFHLTTEVGPWVISTVGAYVHPRHSQGSEQIDAQWVHDNWPGEDIGYNRKFETAVFRVAGYCNHKGCNCGVPIHDGRELELRGYNSFEEANRGHLAMCEKWAAISEFDVPRTGAGDGLRIDPTESN